MRRFYDYNEVEEQIHASQELKERVLAAAREQSVRKAGHTRRGWSLVQKAAVAAILLVSIPVTAYAAASTFGLGEYLRGLGFRDSQTLETMISTYPTQHQEPEQLSQTTGAFQEPEFEVLETICDRDSLYLCARITPKDSRYLLVPSELWSTEDAANLMIPGVGGCTIEEYAQSLGKEILYVGIRLRNDNAYGVSAGLMSECSADGTVYQYFTGENPSDADSFPLEAACHYSTEDQSIDKQWSFTVTVENKSSQNQETILTLFEETGLGLEIHSITLEETELGVYASMVYTSRDGVGYGLSFLNAQGEPLLGLPGSGGAMYEDNGDGTYTSRATFRSQDTLEGLQFCLSRMTDLQKEEFGPFAIYG